MTNNIPNNCSVSKRNYKIAAAMMVKNEQDKIRDTIASVNHLDGIILFDTGSTDDTIVMAKEHTKIPLHLTCGTFVDFSTSRNQLLDFANDISKEFGYDYLLLIDANDELQGDLPADLESDVGGFFIEQKYQYGENYFINFRQLRLIKANSSFRYHQPTHEYIHGIEKTANVDGILFFQNKMNEDKKKSMVMG